MNLHFQKIIALLTLDIKTEYRNKYESYGLFLFVIIVSYILYRGTETMDAFSFNSIFWVFILVMSSNFALRAFTKTKEEESLYLYHVVSPYHIIISKLIYNWFFIFIGGILFLFLGLLFHSFEGFPFGSFLILLGVGSLCISSTFSLPSALVLTSSNRGTLLGILSFPISIPLILVCTSMGGQLITEQSWNMNGLSLLFSTILIMSTVSLYLFKYNWQS